MNDKVIIWHNPKCTKSRNCLGYLQSLNKEILIRLYLDDNPSYHEILTVLNQLEYQPIDLIRKQESDYLKNKDSQKDLVQLMVNFPKIIERPIVIYKEKAAIGRPLGDVINLFNHTFKFLF